LSIFPIAILPSLSSGMVAWKLLSWLCIWANDGCICMVGNVARIFFYQGYILDFGFCMVFSLEFFASKYACVGVVVDLR
jgi:hypothetical protein